jgi:uncharacterized protein YwgA
VTKLHEIIADLVQASNGQLVGRVRLQKIVYLLDHKGLNSGAAYYYHHYGPYSEDVWDAVADAKFFEGLKEEVNPTEPMPSSIFSLKGTRQLGSYIGNLEVSETVALLTKLRHVNSTVLELAATIHWLVFVEKVSDWRAEIERRKAGKTGYGRLSAAMRLLQELKLAPQEA